MPKDPKKSHWMRVWTWLQGHPDAPKFLLNLADSKTYRIRNQRMVLAPKIPSIPQKFTKKESPQAVKKRLKEECERLCKAIVFHRQGVSNNIKDDDYRMGRCITCGSWAKLQWGHFIPQLKSKALQYNPDNTGGQCGSCNGPGQGMYTQYREAINRRIPGLADRLERVHEETKGRFRWTVAGLKAEAARLRRICEQEGIDV